MKLTELRPQFRQGAPDWGDTDSFSQAIAVEFDCPGCAGKPWSHRIWAPFMGRYPGSGACWSASGTGYTDLTFSDAPGHSRSIRCLGGCRSHFNVTAGAIDFYGDSGHSTYRPENTVTEQHQAAPTSSQPAPQTEPAKPSDTAVIVNQAPLGYIKTHFLEFVNGLLHQVHEAPHSGQDPAKVLVPVPGSPVPPGLLAAIESTIVGKFADLNNTIAQAVAERVKPIEAAFEERLKALEAKLASPPAAAPPASQPSS